MPMFKSNLPKPNYASIVLNLILGIMCSSFSWNTATAQPKLLTPIEGVYGKDYVIVNHVDWGLNDSIMDAWCGNKTYNGHQGTDFTLPKFNKMDSGVYVLAADSGMITFIKDGLFDREKSIDLAKGLGNYIAIAHKGKFYTYYGHLKSGSLLVNVGDKVTAGQRIAKVGSSGNSTDPHLHFELWFDSSIVIDPFNGPCGNSQTYWDAPISYDSSFFVWQHGLTKQLLNLNTLRELKGEKNYFNLADSNISYWNLMHGLKKGDDLKTTWLNPMGQIIFEFNNTVLQDFWYYNYWTFIPTTLLSNSGSHKVRLSKNGLNVDSLGFDYNLRTSLDADAKQTINWEIINNKLLINTPDILQFSIIDLQGRTILQHQTFGRQYSAIDLLKISAGTYILLCKFKDTNVAQKIWVP